MTSDQIATFVASLQVLCRIWTPNYIALDSHSGFQQPWLNNLTEDDYEAETKVELMRLDGYLGSFASLPGFNKLAPGVRSKNLDQFSSTVAEIKTLAWLARTGLLSEIRPQLPVGGGESDFSMDVDGQRVYGEVWQPLVLPGEWLAKTPDISVATADQKNEEPKRLGTLRRKGGSQLPSAVVGVWVAHIYHTILRRAWADFLREDMMKRSNVLGAAIWSSSGSNRLVSEGVRLMDLDGDNHEAYWVDNEASVHPEAQRRLLQALSKGVSSED